MKKYLMVWMVGLVLVVGMVLMYYMRDEESAVLGGEDKRLVQQVYAQEGLEPQGKSGRVVKRDYNSETTCEKGKCTASFSTGTRYIHEDDEWKELWEARSFVGSTINCEVMEDKQYPVECVDYNFTSLTIKPKSGLLNKQVPFKLYDGNKTTQLASKTFTHVNQLYTVPFSMNKTLHVGSTSTHVSYSPSVYEDGTVNRDDSDWATARDSADGEFLNKDDASTPIGVTHDTPPPAYNIRRGFFAFNTTAIPDDATIDNANLSLYATTIQNTDDDGDDYLAVVSSTRDDLTNIQTVDYDECGGTDFSNQIDLGNINSNSYNTWVFNAAGKADVNKTGATNLCMREGHDLVDSAVQSSTLSRVYFNHVESASNDPVFNVEYTEAAGDTEDPVPDLVDPANLNLTLTGNITFVTNATDDTSLGNATLYHNLTGSWHANNTVTVDGTFDMGNWTINSVYNATFGWSVEYCDDAHNCAFADKNWTVNSTATAAIVDPGDGASPGLVNVDRDEFVTAVADRDATTPLPVSPRQLARCDEYLHAVHRNSTNDPNIHYLRNNNNGTSADWGNSAELMAGGVKLTMDCYDDYVYVASFAGSVGAMNVVLNYSSDNGTSWDGVNAMNGILYNDQQRLELYAENTSNVWLFASNGTSDDAEQVIVARSVDSGATWNEQGILTLDEKFVTTYQNNPPIVYFADEGTVVIAGANDSSNIVGYRSTDEGASFGSKFVIAGDTVINQADTLFGVHYDDDFYITYSDYQFNSMGGADFCVDYSTEGGGDGTWTHSCANYTNKVAYDGWGCLDGNAALNNNTDNLYYVCEYANDTSANTGLWAEWNATDGWGTYNVWSPHNETYRWYMPHTTRYIDSDGYLEWISAGEGYNITYAAIDVGSGIPDPPVESGDCTCPGSGALIIADGCTYHLNTTCDLGANQFAVVNGFLYVQNGGKLLTTGGCYIAKNMAYMEAGGYIQCA